MAKKKIWVWTDLAHDVKPGRKAGREIEWYGKKGRENVPEKNFEVWVQQRWVREIEVDDEALTIQPAKKKGRPSHTIDDIVAFVEAKKQENEEAEELPREPEGETEPNEDGSEAESVEQVEQMDDTQNEELKLSDDHIPTPKHYRGGIEPFQLIDKMRMLFGIGNIVKYATRAGHKGAYIDDVVKIMDYMNHETIKACKDPAYLPYRPDEDGCVYDYIDSWHGMISYNMCKLLDILLSCRSGVEYKHALTRAHAVIKVEFDRYSKTYSKVVKRAEL